MNVNVPAETCVLVAQRKTLEALVLLGLSEVVAGGVVDLGSVADQRRVTAVLMPEIAPVHRVDLWMPTPVGLTVGTRGDVGVMQPGGAGLVRLGALGNVSR